MKLFSAGILAFASAIFLPCPGSSQDTTAPLHMTPAKDINLTADSIVRRDPANTPGVNRYASEIQLKGHVEIKVCCVRRELREKPPAQLMIVRADEVEYHGDTGAFEAHGTVRVSFQDKMKH